MPERELLTKAEAVEYLHVSIATVNRLMKSRDLAFVKMGKKVLFRREDLDALIQISRIPAITEKKGRVRRGS